MKTGILARLFIAAIGITSIFLLWTPSSDALSSLARTHTRASVSRTAIILNSGSTNTCAYSISVSQTNKATYTTCHSQQGQGTLSRTLTESFFHDIEAAQPLDALPQVTCIKSRSFGTKTYIEYGTQRSPDVLCPTNSIEKNLALDAATIKRALNINTFPKYP